MIPMTGTAEQTESAPRGGARRVDAVCANAVDLARQALDGVAESGSVGEHLGAEKAGERLVTHRFGCTARAYRGWVWAVTLARAPRAKVPTVCEVELLAGGDSVVAPAHVPWENRLQPGDVGAGDVLARIDEDPRLEAGFEATGEEDVDAVALWELGLGRPRVLSREGRQDAASRWETGDYGPGSEVARSATENCGTCGFVLPVTGALRPVFGICANEWSPADGRVVALKYGCGAHSETDVDRSEQPRPEPVLDETGVETVDLRATFRDEDTAAQP